MILKESSKLELKERYTKTVLKTISAFATYEGGEIYFGIKDDGTIIGVDSVDTIKLTIENAVRDNINPTPLYSLEEIKEENKTIIRMQVRPGPHAPYFYDHKVYKRLDTSTAPVDLQEVKALIMTADNIGFDQVDVKAPLDLVFSKLEKSLSKVSNTNVKINEKILKSLNLIQDSKYTVGADILSDFPSEDYASLDIIKFGESSSIFIERNIVKDVSLLDQYQEGLNMFDRWYHPYEEVSGYYRVQRIPIPREAFREVLANALVHQDYSINAAVRISMFENRIEITSAGGLPNGITKEDYLEGELSIQRNPIIAGVFHRLGIIEKFGTGINRIKDEYKKYNDAPDFHIKDNLIKVVLPKINYQDEESHANLVETFKFNFNNEEKVILKELILNNSVTYRELEKNTGLDKRKIGRIIDSLANENIIEKHGSTQKRWYKILIDISVIK